MNATLFQHQWLIKITYPILKLIRKALLLIRSIPPIVNENQLTLCERIFGDRTESVPQVLQHRYANRSFSTDRFVLEGEMTIRVSKIFQLLSPLFRLSGALVPYAGEKIPVTVELLSAPHSAAILMRRTFNYPNKAPYLFSSSMIHDKNNLMLERMKFGFTSKQIYSLNGQRIIISCGGYALLLGKKLLPLPMGLLIGGMSAFEEAIDLDQFKMAVKLEHPLFGRIFQYEGQFKIIGP